MNEQVHKQMSSILKQLAISSDGAESSALAKQAWALYDANPGVWTSGATVKWLTATTQPSELLGRYGAEGKQYKYLTR